MTSSSAFAKTDPSHVNQSNADQLRGSFNMTKVWADGDEDVFCCLWWK